MGKGHTAKLKIAFRMQSVEVEGGEESGNHVQTSARPIHVIIQFLGFSDDMTSKTMCKSNSYYCGGGS